MSDGFILNSDPLDLTCTFSSEPSLLEGSVSPDPANINSDIISSGPQGLKGEKGDRGLQGDKGDQGEKGDVGDDLTYTHYQMVASKEWVIPHMLSKFVSITIVDSSGNVVEGDIIIVDINTAIIRFNSAFSGRAFIN